MKTPCADLAVSTRCFFVYSEADFNPLHFYYGIATSSLYIRSINRSTHPFATLSFMRLPSQK